MFLELIFIRLISKFVASFFWAHRRWLLISERVKFFVFLYWLIVARRARHSAFSYGLDLRTFILSCGDVVTRARVLSDMSYTLASDFVSDLPWAACLRCNPCVCLVVTDFLCELSCGRISRHRSGEHILLICLLALHFLLWLLVRFMVIVKCLLSEWDVLPCPNRIPMWSIFYRGRISQLILRCMMVVVLSVHWWFILYTIGYMQCILGIRYFLAVIFHVFPFLLYSAFMWRGNICILFFGWWAVWFSSYLLNRFGSRATSQYCNWGILVNRLVLCFGWYCLLFATLRISNFRCFTGRSLDNYSMVIALLTACICYLSGME